jgi:hypothetical protein
MVCRLATVVLRKRQDFKKLLAEPAAGPSKQ